MKRATFKQRVLILSAALAALTANGAAAQQRAIHLVSVEPAAGPAIAATTLDELISLGLAENPGLTQAALATEAALGDAVQAGLYPNPNIGVKFDELGDREGPGGINTLPAISQEIVTAGKLRVSREAGLRQRDQATWRVTARRYQLLAAIRAAYFDALGLQSRIEILDQMLSLADKSVEQTGELLRAGQAARLDQVQLEVEAERLRAAKASAERELPGAYKRLAAVVGVSDLTVNRVAGTLDLPLPEYDLESLAQRVIETHPEINAARYGYEQARLLLRRAQIEPIPNVNLETGYVRQNQNRSNDFMIGASVTVPLWNRNQGAIRAASARVGEAAQQIRQAENELSQRLAEAYREFSASRQLADRYRTAIMPRAGETYQLSLQAYQGGEFEYLRVLEAQRALAQANLEYVRALTDAWRSAAAISGLTLEDRWPDVDRQTAE